MGKNIVIVAGGEGTRFKHLSVFPKILLPTPMKDCILKEQVDFFGQENSNITVIINQKYENMLSNYVQVNNINVKIVGCNNINGSFNTIFSVYDKIPHSNVLFVWSDLIPQDYGINSIDENGYTIIIDDIENRYRFSFIDGKIKEQNEYNGNIPGMYYFQYLFKEKLRDKKTDLIEYIQEREWMWKKYEVKASFIEYRDIDTYRKIYKTYNGNKNKTRFFNELSINGNILTKRVINEKYRHLIEKEQVWYKEIKEKPYIPKIYECGEGYIKMEYLKNYKRLCECLNDSDILDVYNNIFNSLRDLENDYIDVGYNTFLEDLKIEIVEKTLNRCNSIKNMLLSYNEIECEKNLNEVVKYILKECKEGKDYRYVRGHGDLNGSNIMVNKEGNVVKFIDPRGYFGHTLMYIPRFYEDAKLLYCLYGYDDFNVNGKIYNEDEPILYKSIIKKIPSLNTKLNRLLVGVIYIALSGYISQDIMKANIAYEYGMKILKAELDEENF